MTDCFSVLLPVFVNLINLSFKDGLVPALFKEAVLDPVIKKDSLDHEIYQNYRPISNLRFVPKATEKIVALRLTDHLEDNDLLETYKKHTRRDTVRKQLLRELMMTYSERSMTMLVLFLFFWTFQQRLTPLTTKYYSHD